MPMTRRFSGYKNSYDCRTWWLNSPPDTSTIPATKSSTELIDESISLFGSAELSGDYAFAKTALQQLSIPTPIASFTADDGSKTITLSAPRDLQERLRVTLPMEVRDVNHRYVLSADKKSIVQAIDEARQAKADTETWPKLHYLWPQHPIMDWLSDRVLTAFGRHRAPVIQCPQLLDGEQAFVLMGLIPNRKGQPLLIEWQVAVFNNGQWSLQAFPEFVARTKLKAGSLANRNQGVDTTGLQANLPGAVAAMKQHMVSLQEKFAADMTNRLSGTLADLERLQNKQFAQLELRLEMNQQGEQIKKSKREQRKQHIRKVFDEYRQWVQDTMTTEPQPFIQVLAAALR